MQRLAAAIAWGWFGGTALVVADGAPQARGGDFKPATLAIEALDPSRMENARLPQRLVDDEQELVDEGIDLPVLLLRCAEKPGAVWTLRLPEFGILGEKGICGYQTAYRWRPEGARGFVSDWQPLTSPDLQGRVRMRAALDDRSRLNFEVVLRNESSTTWRLPAVWICLIHRYAGGGSSFYWGDDMPLPTADVPDPESIWLKWLAVRGQEHFAESCRRWAGYKVRPGIAARPELVWRAEEPTGFQVRIGGEQAGLLGWSKWPCTDMAIVGADLPAGEDRVFRGYVEMGVE